LAEIGGSLEGVFETGLNSRIRSKVAKQIRSFRPEDR
jgi:hypothetical protein